MDFVDSYWAVQNEGSEEKTVVVLPDGSIDLIFSKSGKNPYQIMLLGLSTEPDQVSVEPFSVTFGISFKPLALEYILHSTVSSILNHAEDAAGTFGHIADDVLDDFEIFCTRCNKRVLALLPDDVDSRKRNLFKIIYEKEGGITVAELSDLVFWSSRQIGRYFNDQIGISVKKYCNIIRFRAAFQQIKSGKLFPEGNYADQSHFIKEIKRLSGARPKDLYKNLNDRFVNLVASENGAS